MSTPFITPDLLHPAHPEIEVVTGALCDALVDVDDPTTTLVLPVGAEGLSADADTIEALAALGMERDDLAAMSPRSAAGATTSIPVTGERSARLVVLVGTGQGRAKDLREAGAAVARTVTSGSTVVTTVGVAQDMADAVVEGMLLGGYVPPRFGEPREASMVTKVFVVGEVDHEALARSVRRSAATMLARNLAYTPSNLKNPEWMAQQARALGKERGLSVKVTGEKDLAKRGFGGIIGVGQGSASAPRLIELSWKPKGATADTPHVVLVGKGVTFDTGGLDIKPADGMLGMKTDMSGSAVVLAVLSACRDLGVACRVTGLLPCAENAVSGTAFRPSDVLTMYGGRTIEVGNTDAEGRIVLADALAYAAEALDATELIDIATLTGAVTLGLGRTVGGYYVTDDAMRAGLESASARTGEDIWELPLVEDYRYAINSEVADLANMAMVTVGGGSITAALFLREFTGGLPWAHFDIAGVGRSTVDAGMLRKGPTAFGVRMLLSYLESR